MSTIMKISGGLGNQLFQYAASDFIASGQSVILDTSIYSIRSYPREVSLKRYKMPRNLEFETCKQGFFLSKLENLAMRLSCAENRTSFTRAIYKCGLSLIVGIMNRGKGDVSYQIAANIGWDSQVFQKASKPIKYLGYFQSHLFIRPELKFELEEGLLTPNENSFLQDLKRDSEQESPLVVHLRFGDYLNNSTYAVVTEKYYEKAIEFQMKTGLYRSIWLFSDDPQRARSYISKEFEVNVRLKERDDLNPAVILEAMRFGRGYVLTNSTFGWWGAWLSYTLNPFVVTPTKWFSKWENPANLIPDGWICFEN